eukprot:5997686-Amphidinium_carterae.1
MRTRVFERSFEEFWGRQPVYMGSPGARRTLIKPPPRRRPENHAPPLATQWQLTRRDDTREHRSGTQA